MPKQAPKASPPGGATPKDNRLSACKRGYNRQWEKARSRHLAKEPLCRHCLKEGKTTVATVVDHIIPHKGDEFLFWDSEGNWQSLCKWCHNKKSARE
jgi:5-methylcytosine-specific restriction protein A